MQEKQRSWLEHVDVAKLFLPMLGLVASALSYAGLMEPWLSAVWITAMSLILVVYLRKNRLLLFISLVIAYACYSICYVNYFNPLSTTMYTSLSGTASAQTALSSLLLFLSVLLIFSPKKNQRIWLSSFDLLRKERKHSGCGGNISRSNFHFGLCVRKT